MKKQFSNLDEWLDWQQTLHSKNIDFKLERIKSVYKKLKINKIAKKVIIVAGTNGKGFVAGSLWRLLSLSNINSGLFTSPHLFKFQERIQCSNKFIDDKDLIGAFAKIKDSLEEKFFCSLTCKLFF